jgi:CMP-N,N'-diacetyllegionaminic acid synthase
MICDLSVLAVVAARGGSRRVPGKNVRTAGGRPLIAWTIRQGAASRFVDRLVVSTDDDEIMRVAREAGAEVPFKRPARLAMDDTPGVAPVLHALDELPGFDIAVLLQPTSPLRATEDIDACIDRCAQPGIEACVTVAPLAKPLDWTYYIGGDGKMTPVRGSGGGLEACALNGAVYAARAPWLRATRTFLGPQTVAYRMPLERSLDIDTEEDFAVLDLIMKRRGGHDA